ncbi:Transcription initiation factor TFIID subunit 2 [Gnomoniopsis smithogilvyi]|uniref:Transcription initiation factor TFIID subunit 2 n=1 Tax=Gnomoniopsis smithogilvyi TaxID=1191159 RepID=A0A9W8YWR0_9PEZI|nr:Transcription initiation factor TFIID subunit 2 [Gnomoniopsis smithogilvyi]
MMEDGDIAAANGAGSSVDELPLVYEPFNVITQNVHLDLRFREKQIIGTTTLQIFKQRDDLEYITLDARQCEIDTDGVTVNNQKVKVEYRDPYELMDTPDGYSWTARQHHLRTSRMRPLQTSHRAELSLSGREQKGCQPAVGSLRIWLKPDNYKIRLKPQTPGVLGAPSNPFNPAAFEVTISYKITNVRDGLHFAGVDDGDDRYPHAYTRHSAEPGYASSLFPCVDDRTRLVQWKVSLQFPKTVADALGQPLASHPVAQPNAQRPREALSLTEGDKLLELTAVCSGNLVGTRDADGETKIMDFEVNNCGAQHIGFAVGPFEDVDLYSAYRSEEDEQKLGVQAVKVHGYCLPGRRDEVCNTCQPLAFATDFFTLTFSKYPYDQHGYKLCFVDDMVEDTMPLLGFSLISSRLLYPEDVIDTEIEVTRKLVHTIASQYFGIYIQPDKLTDTWIVVGLAYYMTDLFLRRLAGNNYYRYQMRIWAERLAEADYGRPSLHDLGRILYLGDFEMEFMALKASLVVFILDRRLMKSSNSSGVTRVVSQRIREAKAAPDAIAATSISSEQFRKQCEKRGRLRLEEFWDQWVKGSGCPRFSVTQRFNKKRLEVEVTVIQNQVKWSQEQQKLDKKDFWRDIVEERHNIEASEVPLTFTGPMTFRVHEADGTPYEHCLEIKLDASATKGSRLSMPYNTKYKRIKRTRQNKKAREQGKGARDPDRMDEDGDGDDDDKGHGLSTFGDVLVNDDDMASWRLVDWDENMQAEMDQESYEWIRVDCDFEWIYNLETNFKVYMTVAQLQQDRDIAGQVESMLALTHNIPSNIQTTMLLRTLYDNRYFYGIRTMAANALTRHAEPANNFRGMHHLIRVFKKFFCYPDTTTPRPNNFSNKKEYYVQMEIPMALARIRGGQAFCPEPARQLILDQLVFNNNEENPYSDQFYVAKLLEALATSLVRAGTTDAVNKKGLDEEMRAFVDKALDQIDRYEKMDEWMFTHNNIWTVAALDCKMKLMKSAVIPLDPTAFMRYCLDENSESVQIKAFEALIELGFLLRPQVMKLLVAVISTHRSPHVRAQLFKVFTHGLAAIAFGELEPTKEQEPASKAIAPPQNPEDNDLLMDDEDDGGLVIEKSDDVIKRRQDQIARQKDISVAIKALKEALQNDKDLERELWKALDSPVIGVAEKRNLLELCATLFPEEDEMLITLKYPVRWSVSRAPNSKPGRSLILNFTKCYQTASKRKRDEAFPKEEAAEAFPSLAVIPPVPGIMPGLARNPAAAPPEPEKKEKQPEKKKIKLSRAGASNLKATERSPAASPAPPPPAAPVAPVSRAPSIAVASSRPAPRSLLLMLSHPGPSVASPRPGPELERGDSISVLKRPLAQLAAAAPSLSGSPTPEPARSMVSVKSAKTNKKRKLAEIEAPAAGPANSSRKILTFKYRFANLTDEQRRMLASFPSSALLANASDSIVATPAARARVHATSPLPPNAESSFTSSVSVSSSSQTLQASQKTPLPNGKARKPLPSGSSGISPPMAAKSAPLPRSIPGPSGSGSPVPSGSGRPRRVVTIKLLSDVLKDAAAEACAREAATQPLVNSRDKT